MRFLSVVVLLLIPVVVAAQETPRAVLERAVKAHGGQEKLAASRPERLRLKGTIQVGPTAVPFTNEMALHLPAQYRSVVRMMENGREHTVVHLLDGDKASILLNGQAHPASDVHLAQLRQTLQLEHALRLVPLLTDPAYTLLPMPEVRYNTHVFIGVRVQAKGQREVKLYFDQASGLLVKTEHQLDGPGGKGVLQEAFYANHRDVGGRVRAGTVVILRDGKKVMESELLDARAVERIDPREFQQP